MIKLILLSFIIFTRNYSMALEDGMDVNLVPNPMKNPTGCGRGGVERSAVCDPLELLSIGDKDIIDGTVNGLLEVEFAVVVLSRMQLNTGETPKQGAERYAKHLHNKWGVGKKEEQNGAVVFLAVDDRVNYISLGKGLTSAISSAQLETILGEMLPFMKKSDYAGGVLVALNSLCVRNSTNDPFFTLFLFIFGITVYSLFHIFFPDPKRKGENAFKRLVSEVKDKEKNPFGSTSCPICLEPFTSVDTDSDKKSDDQKSNIKDENDLNMESPIVTLICGHSFCTPCMKSYLSSGGANPVKCPICRRPICSAPAASSVADECVSHSTSNQDCSADYNNDAEVLFRINRVYELYPEVVTASTRNLLSDAVRTGNFHTCASEAINRMAAAAESGSNGSSSSDFGGGSCDGGGGGGSAW